MFKKLAMLGIKEETIKKSNNKPHLPSIFVELCRAVFTACVYLIKSTPYFLLFSVRFGLKIDKKESPSTLCLLGNFACFCCLLTFLFKINFSKISFRGAMSQDFS